MVADPRRVATIACTLQSTAAETDPWREAANPWRSVVDPQQAGADQPRARRLLYRIIIVRQCY
ncbi:hypothetical protein E2562_016156 [Oryza meyeriana var. granulata]|uniref:Uncharacterized protein n=1 Tax=Oryza meyeriana var. granulata TaxID=110450 RepID=A0A6G1F8M3_9ORYZ|nr:hypothetical protein E2562_016156 [Oryza meyeriana var. granulata]